MARQRNRRRSSRRRRSQQNQNPSGSQQGLGWFSVVQPLFSNAPGIFLGLGAFHFMVGGPEVQKIYVSSGVAIAALLALLYFMTLLPGVKWLVKGKGKSLDNAARTQVWVGICLFTLLYVLASAWQ